MPIALNKQIFRVNSSQTTQIASFAFHQVQQHNQQVDISSSIRPVIAHDTMGSIIAHNLVEFIIFLFYTIETNLFLMLGLSPATAFRMFPPLEQFPADCVPTFIIVMQCSSLSALFFCTLSTLFPVQHLYQNDVGLLTVVFRQMAGNNPVLNSLLRFIRTWLFMASLHVLCFQFMQEPDILFFLIKARTLYELL